MITKLRIRPARAGMGLRDPRSKELIPDDGAEVDASAFWRRRLAQGHVVEAPAPAKPRQGPQVDITVATKSAHRDTKPEKSAPRASRKSED